MSEEKDDKQKEVPEFKTTTLSIFLEGMGNPILLREIKTFKLDNTGTRYGKVTIGFSDLWSLILCASNHRPQRMVLQERTQKNTVINKQ